MTGSLSTQRNIMIPSYVYVVSYVKRDRDKRERQERGTRERDRDKRDRGRRERGSQYILCPEAHMIKNWDITILPFASPKNKGERTCRFVPE
jgi:hypothetical protein